MVSCSTVALEQQNALDQRLSKAGECWNGLLGLKTQDGRDVKVTISALQESNEKKKLSTALELRKLNIPHYFVLGKQRAKMHDDLEEFYIHIVFQPNAPDNQQGIEFPPQKK